MLLLNRVTEKEDGNQRIMNEEDAVAITTQTQIIKQGQLKEASVQLTESAEDIIVFQNQYVNITKESKIKLELIQLY